MNEAVSSRPEKGLLLTTLIVGIFIVIPTAYQNALINVPQMVFERFENQSFASHYGRPLSSHGLAAIWGLTASSSGVGSLAASFCLPWLTAKFGRRRTVFYFGAGATMLGGVAEFIAYYANSFELFIAGQFLAAGIGSTLTFAVGIVFVSDCSPPEFRGMVATLLEVGNAIGTVAAYAVALPNVIGSSTLWPFYALAPSLLSLVAILLTSACLESPKHLYIFEGNLAKCKQSLDYYYGKTYKHEKAIADYDDELTFTKTSQVGIKEIFTEPHLRKPLIISTVAGLFIIANGPTVMSQFSTSLFQSLKLSDYHSDLLTVASAIPGIPLALVSAFVVDRWGRRPLLVGGGFITIVLLCLFVVMGAVQEHSPASIISGNWVSYAGVATLFLNSWINTVGPFAVGTFIFAELLPQTALSVGSMIIWVICNIGYVLLTLLFPPLQDAIGYWAVLVLCVAPSLLLWWYLFVVFVETKQKPVNAILGEFATDKSTSEQDYGSTSVTEVNGLAGRYY